MVNTLKKIAVQVLGTIGLFPITLLLTVIIFRLFYTCSNDWIEGFILIFSGIVAWLVCRKIQYSKYFIRNVIATFILSVLVGSVYLSLFNCARCITPSGIIMMNISTIRSIAEKHQVQNNHSFESLCEDQILVDRRNKIYENLVRNDQRCYGPILRWLIPQKDVGDQFKCNSTKESFAVEAYLSDSKKYTCVDSNLKRVSSDESIGTSTSCVLEQK